MRKWARVVLVVGFVAVAIPGTQSQAPAQSPHESAPPEPKKADPCSAWTLNGYRLGMAKAEAILVHKTKVVRSTMGLPDGYTKAFVRSEDMHGTLIFNKSEKLTTWVWQPEAQDSDYSKLRGLLADRFGTPSSEHVRDRSMTSSEAIWSAPTCGASVRLYSIAAPFRDVSIVELHEYEGSKLDQ